ncbi:MAG: flagellar hook-basal body complex protein FliE [Candidatus Manganitrophus sp. SA1]|nr:flagellar hook-basal body complex protein FliE [Candidatus Manganitrophus morganii]
MAIQPIGPNQVHPTPAAGGSEKTDASFVDTLKESIRQVNDAQLQADQAITDLTTGKQQDLHQTMIAIEKASLSFELMMQVRNKIVSAYEEISRMQI